LDVTCKKVLTYSDSSKKDGQGWPIGSCVRLVVGRPELDSLVKLDQKTLKVVGIHNFLA